jgi:hypothetical protein
VPHVLLIFPEGTDLHEKAIVKSDEFAEKNGKNPCNILDKYGGESQSECCSVSIQVF